MGVNRIQTRLRESIQSWFGALTFIFRLFAAVGIIALWSTAAPAVELVPNVGHHFPVSSVTFSPDGRLILSSSFDTTVKLWDGDSARLLRTLVGHSASIRAAAFSQDGRKALAYSGGRLIVWDVSSGQRLMDSAIRSSFIVDAAFPRGGATVLTAYLERNNGILAVWDIASGKQTKAFTIDSFFEDAFSPDGSMLATSDSKSNNITIWQTATGARLATLSGHVARISKLSWSADSKRIVSADQTGKLKLWAVPSGELVTTVGLGFEMPPSQLQAIVLSSDGQWIATSHEDKTVRIWATATGRLTETLQVSSTPILSMGFSPNGRQLAGGDAAGVIHVWEFPQGRVLHKLSGDVLSPSLAMPSPDGRLLLSSAHENKARLWEVRSGRQIRSLSGKEGNVSAAAFSPDGRSVLLGDTNGGLKLLDTDSGNVLRFFSEGIGYITSVAFSPDGKSIISANSQRTLSLWDIETGNRKASFNTTYELAGPVAFAPDGRTVLASSVSLDPKVFIYAKADYSLKLLDSELKQSLRSFDGHKGWISSVAFSPDGREAATASWDKTIKIWDLTSGQVLHTLEGHTSSVTSVAYSPAGRTIVSAGVDNTIRIWDAQSGQLLKTLTNNLGSVRSVRFSPDGLRIMAANDFGLTYWNSTTGQLLATTFVMRGDEWLTITPEGFFDASSPAAARALNVVDKLAVSSVDQVYNALYRPDLVREKLAGDPNGKVKAAVAKLDLDKVMASGMAPKVTITSPASGSSSPTDEVTVEATIADQGGGIGKVEWRVNGVTLGLESRGLDRLDAPGGSAAKGRMETVKRTLSLEPGDNRIEVVAYNAKDLIAAEPADVTVKWDGAKTAAPPKLYVLAVGVNDYYDSRLHLAYAVPDATAIAEAFKKAGGGLYASVEVKTVLDSDVTVANLDKVFADLGTRVQPRDVFVFFLAGHGKTENGRYYFLPRDFRYEDETSIAKAGMGQDKFQAWFAGIPARKSLLLYDTCESGSLTSATRGSDIDERLGALNRMARATGRTFLTATTDDAPALEGFHGHGVFTYALLDAFDHADVNHDGLIEISELADYIDQKVPDYSYEAFKLRQIPQRSIVGNNFALANKADVLPAEASSDAMSRLKPAPGSLESLSTAASNKPTHVVIGPADVFEQPGGQGTKVEQLSAGTLLSLVKTEQGWALVARDGRPLGYVAMERLVRIQ